MVKKLSLALLMLSVFLFLFAVLPAQAQSTGSIRGAVYRDANNDGKCGGTGEGALAGIPIRFTSSDGREVLTLQSGADGTYGLVAAGLGTWQVSADPAASQGVVTSAKTVQVYISQEAPVKTDVNFCIGTAAGTTSPPVVLPESGAPAAAAPVTLPALVALLGLAAMALGLFLYVREQRG